MTRHVFANRMVAHVWAQQDQTSGRSGNGNFHFEGRTLYSYREPIARFCDAADGRAVVLITSAKFSVTTSAHCSAAQSALRSASDLPRFHVPDTGYGSVEPDHAYNLKSLLDAARTVAGKAKTARFDSWESRPVIATDGPDRWHYAADASMPGPDGSRPLFLQYAGEAFDNAARYAAAFGLAVDFDGPAEIDAGNATWRERWARYSTPQAARKRAKAAEYRERARERKEAAEREAKRDGLLGAYVEWKAGVNPRRPAAWQFDEETDPEIHAELLDLERAEREQAEREAADAFRLWQAGQAPRPHWTRYESGSAERAAIEADVAREQADREAATRAAWLAGEPVRFHGRDEAGGALLRVRGDSEEIRGKVRLGVFDGLYLETSLGATVPLADAVKAFRFCRHVWARGDGWQRNGETVRIGHFQVDRIYAETGDMRAGCHLICRAEIERLAVQLGLADVEPSADAVEPRPAVAAE
jgi:hypothetical protein